MEKFVIDGGTALSGTIVPAGNKNGALPILAASVLTEDEVVVRNVPKIKDVAARRGHPDAAEACQQRAREQERRADALGQLAVDDGGVG